MRLAATTTIVILLATVNASADSLTEHDFILNCAGCHKMNGTGSEIVPSLHDMGHVVGRPGSRTYLIQVPGVAHAPLSDKRLAALVNWLIERFTGRAPAPPYDAAEVSALRKTPLLDPLAERAKLLSTKSPGTPHANAIRRSVEPARQE